MSSSFNHSLIGLLSRRSINDYVKVGSAFLTKKYADLSKLKTKDLTGHFGCVNAIEFSNGLGEYIASGGDDRRVLVWNVEKALSDIGQPRAMKGQHHSNIFCIGFDITNSTLFSGGNDEQVIVHDIATGETKDVFTHEDAVYGLSPDPTNPSVFASACDDGRILIYDIRDSCADPFCLANYTSSMHSVMYNQVEPRLLATANAKEGVGLWDVRKPKSCLLRYGGSLVQQSSMSVRFNQRGDRLVALRRRLPPVMYGIHSNEPLCEFDHAGYYNSCTMKSISFAGENDQYVLSGSDEFNLYMWAVPEDLSERMYINSAHMVLGGHRSIVNQVRFNPSNHIIISSGVEKIIKVWSPFDLPTKAQKIGTNARERRVYSHEEYINLVLRDGYLTSHDYSHESTEEDPRMMAFFDSLVQRELDGWSSDESMTSNEEALYSRIVQLSQSDIDSDDSLAGINSFPDSDTSYSPFTIAFASVMASQAVEGNDRFPQLNRALENAEQEYSNITASGDENDDDNNNQDEENLRTMESSGADGARSADNMHGSEASAHRLSELVRKKKEEMKTILRRRMKECRDLIHGATQETTANHSDSDTSSVSSLNVEIGEFSGINVPLPTKKVDGASTSTPADEARIHVQRRVKMLNNLRKRIMQSDSDQSDDDFGEKKLSCNGVETEASEENVPERIQFKKLKFTKNQTKSSNQCRAKSQTKSTDSTDWGPFIHQSGGMDDRKLPQDEDRSGKKHSNNFELSSRKGKHKVCELENKKHSKENSESDSNDSESQTCISLNHQRSRRYSASSAKQQQQTEKCDKLRKRTSYHDNKKECEDTRLRSHHRSYRAKSDSLLDGHSSERTGNHSNEHRVLKHSEKTLNHHDTSHRSREIKSEKSHSKFSDSKRRYYGDRKSNSTKDDLISITESERDKHHSDQSHKEKSGGKHGSRKSSSHSVHSNNCLEETGSISVLNKSNCKGGSSNSTTSGATNDFEQPSCSYSTKSSSSHHSSRHSKKSSKDCSDKSSSSDDAEEQSQPTWLEFKRFKNQLKRARDRYSKEKGHKDHKRFSHE
ncbi:hypothetical protein DPMN_096508 [Dreissena polymorpha]|uniref:DDB1- and CUL4-associated factor 5 n=2 Tax=Dreissena polymorpha TaxID=45954 RepID=A0A9D4L8H1_DREPO|nr:hypothetical protein DPMN_096508 [Dreissena polymorpha]